MARPRRFGGQEGWLEERPLANQGWSGEAEEEKEVGRAESHREKSEVTEENAGGCLPLGKATAALEIVPHR